MPTPGTVEYPTALDGVVSLFEVGNRAFTTLSADINNSVLAIPLTDSTVFPTTGVVTLTDSLTAPTKHEEIIFTANAANSLTVPVGGRGAFGSTAQNWSGTVYVRMRMIAEHHEVLRDAIIQLETIVEANATPLSQRYQPLDSDLTAIAALSPSNDDIIQRKAGAWTNRTMAQLKSDLSLNNVENTALSTWAGSANLTTLGTIATGTWNGSVIGSSYGGAGSVNGILKANGSGVVSAASAGTDYLGVTAPGSSGQLLYNNGNAYAAVAGSAYSASADHSLSFTPTVSKAGLLIYQPTSTAPATVVGAPALLQLHTVDDLSYWQLSYSSDAITDVWANYLYSDGGIWFSHSNGTDTGYFAMWRNGFAALSVSATYYGGIGEVASDQYGLMLTTTTPSSGAVFPLTWRTTGITQAAPATALADGSVPVNHLHFYQDEATNELKAKWKESGGSVNTITFGSGGASNPFDDATAIIKGSADATKLLRIEVDGITTGTTRVWTAPDANLTVAGIDLAQTWTANQTFGSGILRATSPQITTGINDSNGNELFLFTATGSAVNEITVANAATGNAPTISATGNDADIGLTFSAKGVGGFTFTSSATTGAGMTGAFNSITTGSGASFSSSSLTSGNVVSIAATGTAAASNTKTALNVSTSGANATSTQTTYGARISNTSTGTSSTNYGIQSTASGGSTNVPFMASTGSTSTSVAFYAVGGETGSGVYYPSASQLGLGAAGTERLRLNATGVTVHTALNFGGSASSFDTTIRRNAAAHLTFGAADINGTPVGQMLSVQNATTGTNLAGSTWTLRASLGTGNAVPGRLHLAAGAMSATSGTTQQTAVDRGVIGATKVLTNNSAITITNVTVASNSNAGGQIGYLIEVTDGTDFQYETGVVSFGVTNKGGVFSGNTCTKFGNHQNATAGSLTVTFAISGANPALLSCNANSSLTPSTGFPRITYWLMNESQQAIAIQ